MLSKATSFTEYNFLYKYSQVIRCNSLSISSGVPNLSDIPLLEYISFRCDSQFSSA